MVGRRALVRHGPQYGVPSRDVSSEFASTSDSLLLSLASSVQQRCVCVLFVVLF